MADPRSEPSMDDILASIKRIIADEPSAAPEDTPPPVRPAVGQTSPMTQSRTSYDAGATSVPLPRSPDSILELTDRLPEPAGQDEAAADQEPCRPSIQKAVDRLRRAESEAAEQANPRPVPRDLLPRTPTPRPGGGDVTLDALVREMLEPMLADWIDRNLPDIVERIVQAEIRRITERDG